MKQHIEITRWQQDRLTNIFEMLEEERRDLPMESLEGFVTDTQARIGVDVDIELVDLAIIAAACRIENMEVAGYETRREVALALDLKESAKLLEEMIREEQDAYRRLAQLAKPILKSAAEAEDDLEAEKVDEGADLERLEGDEAAQPPP